MAHVARVRHGHHPDCCTGHPHWWCPWCPSRPRPRWVEPWCRAERGGFDVTRANCCQGTTTAAAEPGHHAICHTNVHCLNKKTCYFYFLNTFIKHWPIILAHNIIKNEVYDHSLAHLILILLLHYLVKFKVAIWPLTTMNSYWVAHALA